MKAVRLCANLWISEALAKRELPKVTVPSLQLVSQILECELNENSEDLILNALSYLSNVLFFLPVASSAFAGDLMSKCKNIMGGTNNSEIRVECLRILGNLSRDMGITRVFREKGIVASLYEVLTGLKSGSKECFYAVGVLMNLASDEDTRGTQMYDARINVLIQKLESNGFEDLELTKNICKLLVNLCDSKTNGKWTNEQIEKVDKVLTSLGDECDSSLV